MTGHDVVYAARRWVGVPYRHQGRSKLGIDCVGLIIVVARELSLLPPDYYPPFNYTRRPKDGALEMHVANNCISIDRPEIGCMVLIRWAKRAPAAHAGILTPDNLIHAYGGNEKVIEHGFRAKWPERVHSFWRFQGVTP